MDIELLKKAQDNIDKFPPAIQQKIGELIAEARKIGTRDKVKTDFMSFVNYVWPSFIHGRHHQIMANAFERVALGECKRLIINMPPRHTKSEFASYLLPAWFLGQFPHKQIIQTAHTTELAVNFGRKVRNLVDSEPYKDLFPNVGLRSDSKAAGRWNTNHNGVYFSIGVGGAVTGRGADLFIIDDAHSEQEATLAEANPEIYDKTFEWYTSGPRQRLQPGGAIVIVMCMTGDTPVLMADKTEKNLQDIKIGDVVATFEKGKLTTSIVTNHKSNGFDTVYKIQTQSGKIVRANERHPFLVMNNGVLEWTRLKNLRVADELVVLKDVIDHQELKQNRGYAAHAKRKSLTIEKTQMPLKWRWGFMENGKIKSAPTSYVKTLWRLKGYALRIIIKRGKNLGLTKGQQKKIGKLESNIGTESLLRNITHCWKNKKVGALYVKNCLMTMLGLTGEENFASTIATIQEKLGVFFATTATSQSDTEKRRMYSNELRRISDFTTDPIVSISVDGYEEVFDVEVERTENFIANGIVSHNTRWSKKDLTGQILKASAQRADENWEVIEFPAILPSGKALWPQFWSIKELEMLRETLPSSKWMAQYQQQPTSDVSAIIKREWWQVWEEDEPPECEYILQSWDTAFTKNERSDYSACTTWGVFYQKDDAGITQANIILLNAFKGRMEFPELKARALREYKEWEPDSLIIEAKASGLPLVYELRSMGIPVQEFTPTKGNDKIARLNACTDVFASKRVWAPNTRWAEEVIDEVASFPSGEHDDLVDSTSQAILRYRKGGFIRTLLDEDDEEHKRYKRKKVFY